MAAHLILTTASGTIAYFPLNEAAIKKNEDEKSKKDDVSRVEVRARGEIVPRSSHSFPWL